MGSPRSGTTWLQLMLASSQCVATSNETHLFSAYLVSQFETWQEFEQSTRQIGLNQLMSEAEFLALNKHFADDVMHRILGKKPNASVILEKTPDHVRRWRDILKIYPEAYFLLIVRDPRAVTASMRAASRDWGSRFAPSSIIENCARWRWFVEEGRRIKRSTTNVMELRYEDLKKDCTTELRHIFAWMGLTHLADECSQIAERHQIAYLRSRRLTGTPWDLSEEPDEFYRKGEIDSWKDELTPTQTYLIEFLTRDLMNFYGYVPATRRGFFCKLFVVRLILALDCFRRRLQWLLRRAAGALSPPL